MQTKPTRKEIMRMDAEELEDCIASIPMDDPLFDFALKQREFMAHSESRQLTAISTAVGVGTLFILVSGQVTESTDLPPWLANWTLLIAAAIIAAVYVLILWGVKMCRSAWARIGSKIRSFINGLPWREKGS